MQQQIGLVIDNWSKQLTWNEIQWIIARLDWWSEERVAARTKFSISTTPAEEAFLSIDEITNMYLIRKKACDLEEVVALQDHLLEEE